MTGDVAAITRDLGDVCCPEWLQVIELSKVVKEDDTLSIG